MAHPLRCPAAVPALFGRGAEPGPMLRRENSRRPVRSTAKEALIMQSLLLAAELPLAHNAVAVLCLVLPH